MALQMEEEKKLRRTRKRHWIVYVLVNFSARKLYIVCVLLGWFLLFLNLLHGGGRAIARPDLKQILHRRLAESITDVTSKIELPALKPNSAQDHDTNNKPSIPEHNNLTDSSPPIVISIMQKTLFVYSAIAVNSTPETDAFWDNIVISGWELKSLYSVNYSCCIVYGDGSTNFKMVPLLTKRHWNYIGKARVEVKQWVCPNPRRELPTSISLTSRNTCPNNKASYLKVEPAYSKQKESFGVCAKLVYGSISASSVIEWLEYQRMMGVDTILVYTNTLNQEAASVLEYYRDLGLVEIHPFELGGVNLYPRKIGVKSFQGWNDEQATVFDCQVRLSGSTYIALYDLDEFVHPFKHKNYLALMRSLIKDHPRAAGFTFKSELYVTTWNQTRSASGSGLITDTYTRRTDVMMDRVKNFIRLDRLQPGRMSTHGFWPEKPYKKAVVPAGTAIIKHYRDCRKEWVRKGKEKCYTNIRQIQDDTMLPVAKKLAPRVAKVKHSLGLDKWRENT